MRSGIRGLVTAIIATLLLAGALAACGSSGNSGGSANASSSGSSDTLTIGYSAWPGWFPLTVADQQGIFTKSGLHVNLKYFADYTSSLDALVAGKLDVNAQTLNDTLFAVAAGSKQKIIQVGDNSTGNDAVICDKSITSRKQLKGKSVAAEQGVVDHFLLLQGLAQVGMTQNDVKFSGVKTDAAAAAFAAGQFDCVAVFAPFTVQALKRPGSHVLFSSKDLPGVIPDHLVASEAAAKRTADMQKLVDAWYQTIDWIKAHPAQANAIMAKRAGLSASDYESLAQGTTLFTPQQSVHAFQDRPGDPTSLPEMARRINPFLVQSGLTKKQADLTGIFEPQYTEKVASSGTAGS